ncbi:MAG: leucine-rich repeat domain-containing protein [Leptolyngbya sp. UWPOB_LEPTO1]|uniref:NACHT domain-containing protein n=1 Tax=Leptolyngbya sp. UWPOB_LEPTO1 TaxID=2815653 RepID=UPI001AC82F1C|nr:leucine-rich repeat domain-containing protein [Leptolyngbya sp. UWPOB_LEPTO1]MBN8560868.1 leucine-rich repeat domain-containing protein [Leptolyngbya sp. UWPOB_LEPTO1]
MSLTASGIGIALKIVAPALAKTLVDNLGIGDKFTNKLLEQSIDTITDGFSEAEKRQVLADQAKKLARQLREEMKPLFEREAAGLDQGSQEAIFLAVAETLLRGSIKIEDLLSTALDAERLTNKLLERYPRATVAFSENEKSLYRQAIAFASASLIETAPQLEGFQLNVTQTMLQQQEELISLVRSQKELAIQQRDRFLARYREMLARDLDKPDKFGVPLLKNLLSQQRLSEAYVQLTISETDIEESRLKMFDGADEFLQGRETVGATIDPRFRLGQRSQNVEQVLGMGRRFVIRGGAGAGKTSLLHWLGVHAARQDFEAPLQHWNSFVPFFIRLRNWVGKGFPGVKDFVMPIAKNIVDEMPVGWVRQQLDSGCALVLIDGVDELPRGERQAFFEALQKLVEEFPHSTYITTSRPTALKDENGEEWVEWENWVKMERFSNCVMEPMTLPKIQQFVTCWHRALPQPHRQEDKDPEKIAADLMRQLRQRPEIRQLAATPLLCTMICALHYENEGTLPGTRIRLYDKCIEMLLEERDKQREIISDVNLNAEQKEGFLMEFAYWLMKNNYSDAEVEEADRQFEKYLRGYNLPNLTGLKIRDFLLERSGLLREPLMGRIDFVHRTFQEYLVAKAVLDHEDLGLLLDHADDDQWREAIIVTIGKGSRKQREKLLSELIKLGDKDSEKRHYLHFLALACLETGTSIDSELRAKIEARARGLLPPKNEEEVATIVRAGEEIVPLLAYSGTLSADEAVCCINALIKIGSLAAMEQLIPYAKARFEGDGYEDWSIARALGQGLEEFEQNFYISQVLCHTNYLVLINTQVQDLTPLARLSGLQTLVLINTQIQDLTLLAGLGGLQTLHLSGAQIQDLAPLAGLSGLQDLDLSDTQIQDFTPLAKLSGLQTLYLSGTQIQDLTPLARLSGLQTLDLSGTQIQDLTPLAGLSGLQELYLSDTQIQDFTPLAKLRELRDLDLSRTQIQDLAPLAGLSGLQTLYLSGTQIQDLTPLARLSGLHNLYLGRAQIQDFTPLAKMSGLQTLDLRETQIQDFTSLTKLNQKIRLYLHESQREAAHLLNTKNWTLLFWN